MVETSKTTPGGTAAENLRRGGWKSLLSGLLLILSVIVFPHLVSAAGGDMLWHYSDTLAAKQEARAVASDSLGNVIIAGYQNIGNDDFYTVKFKADGSGVAWRAALDGSGGSDLVVAVVADANDDVVVTGLSWNGQNYDIRTVKYSGGTGAILWQKVFNGAANGNDIATSLAVDSLNNIYVAGYSQNSNGNDDYVLLKYAPAAGDLLWQVSYSGAANGNDQANAVAVGVGGVAVTGQSWGSGGAFDYLTVKYDFSGNKLWEVRYSAAGGAKAKHVRLDGSGNVIVSGLLNFTNIPKLYTAKYASTDGSLLWSRSYDGTYGDDVNALVIGGTGDVYVAGYTNTLAGNQDLYAARYAASDGAVVWQKIYDSGNGNGDVATGIVVDDAGDVFVSGYTVSGNSDFLTIKYKKGNGSELWRATYDCGGGMNDRPVGIVLSPTGQPLVGGWTDSGANGLDFHVMKYDPGLLNQPTELIATTMSTTSVKLDWTVNSTTEDGFKIERKLGESGTYAQIATAASGVATYTDTTLAADNIYYYRIKAYNVSAGDSLYSNEAHAITVSVAYSAPTWSYIYNNTDNRDDMAMSIATGTDNNPVVTGHSNRTASAFDYFTAKLNRADKSLIWTATYDDVDNEIDVAACIALDPSDRVIVAGYSQLYYAPAGSNINSLFTLRYPSAGPPAGWSAQYNEAGRSDNRPTAIATDATGNFVVAGSGMVGGQNDIIVVKYNVDGTKAWSSTPFDGGGEDVPTAVAIAGDGSVFITGYSQKPGIPGVNNFFTAKYNGTTGAKIWSDVYSVNVGKDNRGNALAIDANGDVYVTGYAVNGSSNKDIYTIKYNGAGAAAQRLWERSVDGAANGDDEGIGVKVDPVDGAIVVAGATLAALNDHDLIVVRYSAAGDLIWKKVIMRHGVDDLAVALSLDQSGYIYVAGNSGSGTASDVISIIMDYEGTLLQGQVFNGTANRKDEAVALAVNNVGEAFLAGYTSRADDSTDLLVLKQVNNYILIPTAFTATPQTDFSKMNLAWVNNTPGTSLRIERTLGPASSNSIWTLISTSGPGTTAFQDTGLNGGTNYCYRIEAFNGSLASRKRTVCATTMVGPPEPIQATALSATAIDVSWNNVPGNTGYKVERKTGAGGTYAFVGGTLTANTTVFHDSGLTAATTYYYRISTVNGLGTSVPSNALSATTLTTTPVLNAPTGITASKIDLSWATVTGNTGYKIERSTDNATWAQIATPAQNATSYSDTTVASGTLYYYRIRATSASGDSTYSSSVSGKARLQTPTMNAPAAASTTQIDLSWTDPNGGGSVNETGFTIEYAPCNNSSPATCSDPVNGAYWGGWLTTSAVAGATSKSITGLTGGRTYRFRITANLTGADSAVSNIVSGTTDAFVQPVLNNPTVLSATAMDLAWNNVSGNTGYKLERKLGSGGTYAQIGGNLAPNTVIYHDSGLSAGGTYYYRVSILNSVTGTSNEVNAITLPAAPNLSAPTGIASSQMTLSWGNITGNAGYKIERSTDNATWTQVATPATDATTSTISGLSSGTLYYFRIRATNASGDSAYSSSVSAKTKLQTPTMNAPTAASATQIDLSWSDVNGGGGVNETGFTIEYAPCNNSTPAACSDPVNGAYWGGWVTTTAVADATTKSITGLTGGRTYRFRITANLAGADSATSNIVSGTTTSFVQPVLNTPTVLSTTAMDLAWNNESGNTGYKLERKLGSGGTYAQIGGNLATDTVIYHDTGLSAGTTYYYRVSILNSVSGTSNEVSAITLPAAPNPSAPTGITSSQMTLSWVNITGNAGYKIERSTDNATWTQIATPATDATTSTISGLSSGTLYYFRIRSTNISGDSAYSSSVSAKTKLQTPTMNAPTAASTTQIDLSWADPNGGGGVNETGFTIEYAPCNNSTPATCSDPVNGAYWGAWVTTTAAADATTKSIAGLTGGRTYRFRITANLTGADSAVSTIVSGTTTSFVQPVLDNPTVLSTTTMDVAWNNVSGNTGYKLERKLGSGGTYAQIGGNLAADTVIYHDSGLTSGTTYYYRVSVLNSVSGTSNEVSAITLPIAPTLNAPSGITPSQINLSWANITGNTGYKLERSSDNVTWSEIATPAQNAVGYSDTAVTSGTLYYYRIRATNASGDSAYSATVSAKAKLNSPVLSSATASSTTQVALVWTDVNGSSGADETGITIEYSLCSNLDPLSCSDANGSYWGSWSSTTAAADSTSFTIGSLVTGRSYRFRVTATLSGANSDPSGMLVATTYITAPSDLTATVSSTSSMTLSWTDIAGETNYKVEQDGTLLPGITLAKNSNTYTVNSLGLNTQYCFRVQPYNSTSSAFSNQACATIYGPTTLNSVTAGAGPRIDLGWADVDGESGYEVWQSTAVNQSSPPAGVGTGSWNTYTNLTATPLTTNTISYGITSGLTAGYTYKYQVRYKLPDNTYSPYSNEMMVTTIPPTPASFTGSVASSSQVNLSWTDGYGESAYNVQYKVRAGSFCSSEDWTGVSSNAVAANANSYSATGLTPGAIYCFRMNASNSSGSSAWTTVATYIALLDAPTLNAPSNIGQMTLDLSWNNLTGNTGYKIERSTSNTFAVNLTTFTVVANTTTYTDIGLTPGQTYYYRISAKNAADVYSAASGTQSATTLVVPSPVLDALSGVTFSKIDLSWGNVAGNVGYRLERSTASNFAANLVTTPLGANVTSYSDTTVNGNTTYYYRVSTQNSGNFYSDPSSVQSTTTPVITVPTLNALSGITQVSIDLSWGNIAGNNGYKIERSLYSSFSSVTTINVVANASTYTDSGLIPNKTYYYRIYTKNSGGFYSAASSSKSGTTLTVTSPAITFSGVTQTQATLSWIDVPGNTGYYVDRIMPYGWWGLAADLGAGVTTWTDTGLTTGTTYTYRARSKNGSYGASYTVTTITAAPTAPTLSAVSESQIDLTWQTVQGGTGYKVMRSVGPDGPWNEVLNVTAPYSTLYCGLYANPTIGCSSIPAYTSTSDTGLSENTQYCYQLKATSSGGDSALSGTACQKTLSVGGPTVTSVTALNSMVIKVDWAYNPASCTPVPCSNPDAFEVDIKLWNGEWMRKGLVNGSTFTFTDTKGIQPAKSYSYRVRAVAGAELSAYSNQVSITTPAFRSVDGTCR